MLLLLNGPPGVGKSTVAHRHADEHALTLVIEVDDLRMQLGRWATIPESKSVARDLALALARAHLARGLDVVVPQYVGRPDFRDRLRGLADDAGEPFVEAILTCPAEEIADRFLVRRRELARRELPHPQAEVPDEAVASNVAAANDELLRIATGDALMIDASGGPDSTYEALVRALDPSG